jgi:acetyl esterase/lipase
MGLDPERIAVTGFSAGGHVAARLATRFGRETYAPVDAADRSRPGRRRRACSIRSSP